MILLFMNQTLIYNILLRLEMKSILTQIINYKLEYLMKKTDVSLLINT